MMYDVAQINLSGIQLVLVPVNPSIDCKTTRYKRSYCEKIEQGAQEAGMQGAVVLVWRGYTGRMKCLTSADISSTLSELSWGVVMKHLTRKLTCDPPAKHNPTELIGSR